MVQMAKNQQRDCLLYTSNKRLKGIHVLDHYVSMDEYEANRDAR